LALSLTVRDARHLRSAASVARACTDHLTWACNGGHVRPLITVFAPESPGRRAPRFLNKQLVAYAGHRQADGTILGDAGSAHVTDIAKTSGWRATTPATAFDVLPLLIEDSDRAVTAVSLSPDLAFEVPIAHPEHAGLEDMGLRWYGFPTISDMELRIGGITYPSAPFTGWYVAPEVSARDLTDPHRYNLLEPIAAALGLDTHCAHSTWKDRALVELTVAVLHSFDRARVRMDDHHVATARFDRWVKSERMRGRTVDADWRWMVPPISGSATPVFHEHYGAVERCPNFFRRADG